MTRIDHICYHVDMEELIGNYIALLHHRDIVIVIHNPVKYKDYLKSFGFYFDEVLGNFDYIRILQVNKLEDAVTLLKNLDPIKGPICSLWVYGNKLSDNIEENIKSTS